MKFKSEIALRGSYNMTLTAYPLEWTFVFFYTNIFRLLIYYFLTHRLYYSTKKVYIDIIFEILVKVSVSLSSKRVIYKMYVCKSVYSAVKKDTQSISTKFVTNAWTRLYNICNALRIQHKMVRRVRETAGQTWQNRRNVSHTLTPP